MVKIAEDSKDAAIGARLEATSRCCACSKALLKRAFRRDALTPSSTWWMTVFGLSPVEPRC